MALSEQIARRRPARPAARPAGPGGRPRVLVVASLAASLVNFRYDLLAALSEQAEVIACAPDHDPETRAALNQLGIPLRRVPMGRTGTNPLADLRTLAALVRLCREVRPDIVFPYTMKPIIYGCLAGRLTGVPVRLPLCTGLGYVFIGEEDGPRARLLRGLSVLLYRLALGGVREALVYNEADAAEFRDRRLVAPDVPVTLVPGSGINLARFPQAPVPEGPPVFLMVGRLLKHKGLFEYVEAARLLRARHPDIRFQLLGPLDANPASASAADVARWQAEGVIEYLGETADVRPHLARASVFVLPSYREGISRSVLEAMATGRAVITSDAPGCAEPVTEGETGFVVPVADAGALAATMERFIDEPALAPRMGQAARRRAENVFDVNIINRQLLDHMGLSGDITWRATA